MDRVLKHYGTPQRFDGDPHGSGRYRQGTGAKPNQRDFDLLARYDAYRAAGITKEADLVKALGLNSSTELRDLKSVERAKQRAAYVAQAQKLHDEGKGNSEIARIILGDPKKESTVRGWLDPTLKERASIMQNTADMLEDQVKKYKYIDVGQGVETQLGISQAKLRKAVSMLEEKGYHTENVYVEQLGTGKKTTIKALVGPDVDWAEVQKNKDKIHLPYAYTENKGRSYLNIEEPVSVDSKRIQVNYESPKDGVIELRRGVEDISLGNAKYAQVRIAVDGTHYLKGMAMYADNMPKGVDIIFNTNKKEGTPLTGPKGECVAKELKKDKDNPFGATIKTDDKLILAQRHYIGKDGKEHLSAINIVNEEGDWENWSKTLSSQFLSKQSAVLAKKQLDLTLADQKAQFDTIKSLTNPVLKKKLLDQFADDCDAKAVDLKATALPRTANHAILPFPKMKENEIYAPNYRDGETVVLIRHPHGGKFEIPVLKVNNNNKEAKKVIQNAPDAVGIHPSVAGRLSGADFDGDTVLVIPVNKRVKVDVKDPNKSEALKGLQNFDPKEAYPKYEGMKVMSDHYKEQQMGIVTNLVTDMSIKGASDAEIARAVRHTMVIIDASKHELNWKQSEIDNQIGALKKKYQSGGASTIISRAGSEQRVDMRVELRPSQMTPEQRKLYDQGKKIYRETGELTRNKSGELVKKQFKSTKMYETDDAYKLTSGGSKRNPGYVMEGIYASYANASKELGDAARRESRKTKVPPVNYAAKKTYAAEIASLEAKIDEAMKRKPLERQAQLIANKQYAAKIKANPDMDKDEKKRLKYQSLEGARYRVNKLPYKIDITDREWEAIQSGALASGKLSLVIDNADIDKVKERAMPRDRKTLSNSQQSRIRSLYNSGYTQREIADKLGISPSTVREYL